MLGFRVLLALTVATAVAGPARSQSRGWEDREYGIGVVKYAAMYSFAAQDVIFAAPAPNADTVATLRGDTLCLAQSGACVRAYDRMIEFEYEVPGWAILEFSEDSAWVKVTLAPADPPGPLGWVHLRPDSVEALRWSEILPGHPLFFLRASDIAFYRKADRTSRIDRPLVRDPESNRLNYIMNPIAARGRWLQVEVVSPSTMCESPTPQVIPDTLWIEYLTTTRRPRVFYYTRGC